MAVKDSVLNFIIKAKNMAGDVVSKFRKDVETLDSTSADASKSVDALGAAADGLGKDAGSASAGTDSLNNTLNDVSENASTAAQSLDAADSSMSDIASAAKSVNDSTESASKSLNDLGDTAQDLGDNTKSASAGTKALVTAVDDIDTKATDASSAVSDLGDVAKDLSDNTKTAGAGAKALGDAMDEVDTSATEAALALAKAEKEAAESARKLHESGVAADKAAASVGKMGQRYDAAGKPIETARQEIKATNDELKETEGSTAKAGTSIGSFTKRLLALAAAAVGIHTITNAFKSMLNTGDQFERLSLQMEQTMGSLAAGEQATEWVKDFAKNTPLQLQEVTDTFLRLKNFGLDPQAGAMQAIVDQAAKLGKGYEAVEGISLALGQAWAKQKLQGEEILQLIERGVPVWDLLATTTGKTTAEIQKMSEAGLLGRDAIKAMIDEMGKQSAGAAAQNMSLLSGYISTLTDEWQLFLNEVAKSGALDYAKDQLRQLIDYIQELKANGKLTEYAQNISDAFISISEASKSVVLAIKDNISNFALLAQAYAAVKLAGFANDAKNLAVTLGTTLVTGTTAAATATKTLATAMRALPWVIVIDQAVKATQAYFDLQKAKQNLAASQATLTKVQADEIAKIKEFNEQTGLSVQTLDEIINMQKAGAVAVDEYTGKWRLATDQLTEAEKAQRVQAEATAKAKAETAAFENQFEGLMGVLAESQKAGKDTAAVIADIGAAALQSGERGVESLSLAIGQLAQGGDEAKAKLKDGLAAFLVSLSEEQYSKFGAGIEAALKRIEGGADQTSNRLSFMKTILEADLAAAAQRAGVDIGKVLTGIDDESKTAIGAFENLATKVKAAGLEGEKANLVLRNGLLNTLKSMDTSKEIDATIASINELIKQGDITKTQGNEQVALAEKRRQEIQNGTNAQKTASEENEKNAGTWILIEDSSKKATSAMQGAGSVAKFLQDAYFALRAEVEALGPAAVAAFEKLQGVRPNTAPITGDFAELKQTIADTSTEIDRLQKVSTTMDVTGINRYLRDTMINAAQVKQEYAEQKLALERLQQAYSDGAISARDFINSARGAASSTSLLNQADLSALKNQIKSAQEQMESFRASTQGTLNSLQSELASLQGNAERVAQLAYEARIADLNAKLEDARATGDKEAITNAQQALKIAQDIFNIKKQQIAEEKKAQEQAQEKARLEEAARKVEETKTQQQASQPQAQPQATPQPANVQRIEIALPSGQTANLTGSADDINNLLNFLNEAGLRSTQ
ncbi:hypothetical protein CBP51_16790 [Cellvibrio mixtus]|uniref:Tape measure protein N-terminal domain-containing protein n=1 Tax=Cellvibrio mixtus TaxID=39650 RepID=A0A266Q4M2_9GAMM|nr:tape measure protein [Cellvibrio mixtus]OZY84818.1 hypothetical protein CBP51_16790 [Cellvibrio mixtus]